MLIYDDDNEGLQRYKEAYQILSTAFRRCHAGAHQQKQQILQYLVRTVAASYRSEESRRERQTDRHKETEKEKQDITDELPAELPHQTILS